jgi:hypothetical protein
MAFPGHDGFIEIDKNTVGGKCVFPDIPGRFPDFFRNKQNEGCDPNSRPDREDDVAGELVYQAYHGSLKLRQK